MQTSTACERHCDGCGYEARYDSKADERAAGWDAAGGCAFCRADFTYDGPLDGQDSAAEATGALVEAAFNEMACCGDGEPTVERDGEPFLMAGGGIHRSRWCFVLSCGTHGLTVQHATLYHRARTDRAEATLESALDIDRTDRRGARQ